MAGYCWKQWRAGQGTPRGAVQGGTDIDGTPMYVSRASYSGDILPAKVMPSKSVAYVSFEGKEVTIHSCEILCEKTFKWVSASGGRVPTGSIEIGRTSRGECLYAGRAKHGGKNCLGKVHPSHGVCYTPFGGNEHSHRSYEVLVYTEN